MRYLVCNTNSYSHTDYQKPIVVQKSTDYRTSTGTNHRYIPPFPQDFDARVKGEKVLLKNPIFKDDVYVTDSQRNYKVKKTVKDPLDVTKPSSFKKVHYLRNVEEKLFRNPPRPIPPVATEYKDEYSVKSKPYECDTRVSPPNPNQMCEMKAFGRDEQPPLRPEQRGFYKLLDIYMTTNRMDYVPYNQQMLEGIGKKDIITYYDANGVPRAGKGYGPRIDSTVKPLVPRHYVVDDGRKVCNGSRNKSSFQTKGPFYSKSEYSDQYVSQTHSSFHPFLFTSGVTFNAGITDPGPWQNLSPVAMYCTEYCHCGTGWPIRAVIDVMDPPKEFVHTIRTPHYD